MLCELSYYMLIFSLQTRYTQVFVLVYLTSPLPQSLNSNTSIPYLYKKSARRGTKK